MRARASAKKQFLPLTSCLLLSARICVWEIRHGRQAATAEPQAPGGPFSERRRKRERQTDRERQSACGCWLRHCVCEPRACESEKQQHCAEHRTQAPIMLTGTAHRHNQEVLLLLLMLRVPHRREKKMRRGGDKRKEREVKKRKRVCLRDYIVLSQEPVCVQHQTAVGHTRTHTAVHLVHCAAKLSAARKGRIWS